MTKLFGTDGIRGVALSPPITADYMRAIGWACGVMLNEQAVKNHNNTCRPLVIIGCDTRQSGCMLQLAIMSGLISAQVEVAIMGCVPTPAVALQVLREKAACGIMVSSSHNPANTNGVKFFNESGYKFSTMQEDELESRINSAHNQPLNHEVSKCSAIPGEDCYVDKLVSSFKNLNLTNLKVVLDCANGSNSGIAERVFDRLGANILKVLHSHPDGNNINENCGAINVEKTICMAVPAIGADIGIAFDGDGDRVVLCDELGQIVDGDSLIAYLAIKMHQNKELHNNAVAYTVTSNMALERFLQKNNINSFKTDVGERNVSAVMAEQKLSLGGEKSGHIILAQHCHTSDGLAAALKIISFLILSNESASNQLHILELLPQTFKNISKNQIKDFNFIMTNMQAKISDVGEYLGNDGRILIRESGTEDIIRIMVECADIHKANKAIEELIEEMNAIIEAYSAASS